MPKLRKTLLTIGIGACLLGGALTTIGSVSGGVRDLLNASKNDENMTKQEETHRDISALDLDLGNRSVEIGESPDDQVHLTYYQGDGKSSGKITVKNENGTLSLSESDYFFSPSVGLRPLLSLFNGEEEQTKVVLTLPKGTNLEKVKTKLDNGSLSAKNLTTNNLEADFGNGSVDLSSSQIQSGSIQNDNGSLTLTQSSLTGTQIHLGNGSVQLNQSSLTDTQIQMSNGSIHSEQLNLTGNISMSSNSGSIELNLTEETYNSLSLDLQTDTGSITLPDDIQVNRTKNDDPVGDKVISTNETAKASLTGRSSVGSIEISH